MLDLLLSSKHKGLGNYSWIILGRIHHLSFHLSVLLFYILLKLSTLDLDFKKLVNCSFTFFYFPNVLTDYYVKKVTCRTNFRICDNLNQVLPCCQGEEILDRCSFSPLPMPLLDFHICLMPNIGIMKNEVSHIVGRMMISIPKSDGITSFSGVMNSSSIFLGRKSKALTWALISLVRFYTNSLASSYTWTSDSPGP